MPRKKIRTTDRGKWTQEDLNEAIRLINDDSISIREAGRRCGIPERTIRRRIKTGDFNKAGCGP